MYEWGKIEFWLLFVSWDLICLDSREVCGASALGRYPEYSTAKVNRLPSFESYTGQRDGNTTLEMTLTLSKFPIAGSKPQRLST